MDTPGPDLFTRVGVRAPDGARAEITPYGAHVTSWVTPDGRERLFLSRATSFSPGSAIRGGVPVVFPQFARRGPLRPHGFARISDCPMAPAPSSGSTTVTPHAPIGITASGSIYG